MSMAENILHWLVVASWVLNVCGTAEDMQLQGSPVSVPIEGRFGRGLTSTKCSVTLYVLELPRFLLTDLKDIPFQVEIAS